MTISSPDLTFDTLLWFPLISCHWTTCHKNLLAALFHCLMPQSRSPCVIQEETTLTLACKQPSLTAMLSDTWSDICPFLLPPPRKGQKYVCLLSLCVLSAALLGLINVLFLCAFKYALYTLFPDSMHVCLSITLSVSFDILNFPSKLYARVSSSVLPSFWVCVWGWMCALPSRSLWVTPESPHTGDKAAASKGE